jgi:hypothetical protein
MTVRIRWTLMAAMVIGGAPAWALAAAHSLKSPDGRIAVEVRADGPLRYDLTVDGKPVVRDASLSLTVDGVALGATARVKGAATSSSSTSRRSTGSSTWCSTRAGT